MFIGRESELNFLEERYSSNKGELVVLYGRRRVGKNVKTILQGQAPSVLFLP